MLKSSSFVGRKHWEDTEEVCRETSTPLGLFGVVPLARLSAVKQTLEAASSIKWVEADESVRAVMSI